MSVAALTIIAMIPMVQLITPEKAKGQSLATTDPSFQLSPRGTGQHVTLSVLKGLVMKRTIRRS